MDKENEGTEPENDSNAIYGLAMNKLQHLVNQVVSSNGDSISKLASMVDTQDSIKKIVEAIPASSWPLLMSTSPNFKDICQQLQSSITWQDSLTKVFDAIKRNNETINEIARLSGLMSQVDLLQYRQSHPLNIRRSGNIIGTGKIKEIELDDGIALFHVIRPELINKLVQATSSEQRRELLSYSLREIIEDCRNAIKQSDNGDRGNDEKWLIELLLEAITVIEERHLASGESLLSGMLSHLVHSLKNDPSEKPTNLLYKRLKSKRESEKPQKIYEAVKRASVGSLIAIAYVPAALQHFQYGRDDMPDTFSRNAIAHHPDKKQFTSANTAQGLLCITSLMAYEFDWENRRT